MIKKILMIELLNSAFTNLHNRNEQNKTSN